MPSAAHALFLSHREEFFARLRISSRSAPPFPDKRAVRRPSAGAANTLRCERVPATREVADRQSSSASSTSSSRPPQCWTWLRHGHRHQETCRAFSSGTVDRLRFGLADARPHARCHETAVDRAVQARPTNGAGVRDAEALPFATGADAIVSSPDAVMVQCRTCHHWKPHAFSNPAG